MSPAATRSWSRLNTTIRSWQDLDRLTEQLVDHERRRRQEAGGRPFTLDAMRRIDAALDRPHQHYPALHVAGSKGKGSVCAFAEALLRARGLKVGTYLSPHVDHWGERLRLDGAPATPESLGRRVSGALTRIRAAGLPPPSFFELLTATSLDAFADPPVDLAVIEVGLGGRLDATNVVDGECSVITAIELEHRAILGRTLSEIAREKAGILRPGKPVVLGVGRSHRAWRDLIERAKEVGASVIQWGTDLRVSRQGGRVRIGVRGRQHRLERPPPLGPHGAVNLALALAAVSALEEAGRLERFPEPSGWLNQALALVSLPGRAERMATDPPVYRDGAHTPRSLAALVDWLHVRHPGPRPVLILGMLDDKDPSRCLRGLDGRIGPLIATEVPGGRSFDPDRLAAEARRRGFEAESAPELSAALERARSRVLGAGGAGSILIAGSFWLAGAVPEALAERRARR